MNPDTRRDMNLEAERVPVLDEAGVAQLRSRDFQGQNLFEYLLSRFAPSAETQCQLIGKAIQSEDRETFEAQVHSLKGSAAAVGARRVWGLCDELLRDLRDAETIVWIPDASAAENLRNEVQVFLEEARRTS